MLMVITISNILRKSYFLILFGGRIEYLFQRDERKSGIYLRIFVRISVVILIIYNYNYDYRSIDCLLFRDINLRGRTSREYLPNTTLVLWYSTKALPPKWLDLPPIRKLLRYHRRYRIEKKNENERMPSQQGGGDW